ncbi:MAG: M48 family metallopeptidase [Gammaproteobacteria bacterium]|nr:M48 family metallopeptidase [Gammaproteobacteria bacterium]MBT4607128.1 M48 family metallopeptidase [Thiotrichales bacterium]MBT3473773.1 M48 family metallopeptidase [Gammaproteobacteria bacterium]MBT3967050.1 M48 family metallopeptidase [Gammaproteobacteria bacterium]MBT4081210.1 M48 family metallopeptidase [Gammaproteobacteria bacterium]
MVTIHLLLELWLSARQVRSVQQHRPTVPEHFSDNLTLEAHQKAADYTTARQKLGQIELLYGTVLLLAWTLGGGLQWLDQLWRGFGFEPLYLGVGFILSLMLIGTLLELPFSLYRTFILEAQFGFNRTTRATYIGDLGKQFLLLLLIGAPFVGVILWLMGLASPYWWLQVWAVWMGFTLLMIWAWPTFLAPLFNKFSPLENENLANRIEALLQQAGFDCDGIFIMDGSKRSGHGNAYFTGLGKKRRIVFYDTLLETLSEEEVLAVLAHELGHFHNNHIKKRLLLGAATTLFSLAILGWLIEQPWFYQGLGMDTPSHHAALVLFLTASAPFTFWLQPMMAAYSRKHEFEADDFAAEHTAAKDLITALAALYRENASTVTPDWLYSAYHDSHPPAPVRIAHLEQREK